jgi:DNA-binding NtrC family response regulator
MAAIRGSANRNEAAARLGISPRTLRYKLARLRDPEGGAALAALGEGVEG